MINIIELLVLERNTWNYVTVYKQMGSNNSVKNKGTYKLSLTDHNPGKYIVWNE